MKIFATEEYLRIFPHDEQHIVISGRYVSEIAIYLPSVSVKRCIQKDYPGQPGTWRSSPYHLTPSLLLKGNPMLISEYTTVVQF